MNSKIELLKTELEQTIKNPVIEFDKVLEISHNIDKEIEEQYIKGDNSDLKELYKKYFNRKDKAKLLEEIKSDIVNILNNISSLELDILSDNLYEFCCLTLHGAKEYEITAYFLEKNNNYCDNLSNKDREKLLPTSNNKLKMITTLTKKYIKIMRAA